MSKMSLEYVINLLDGTFGKNMTNAQKQTSKMDGMVKKLGATMAGVFAAQKVWGLVEESTQVHAKMEALDVRLKTVSGTTERYAQYNAALGKSIKDLALPIMETKDAFGAFAASTQGSRLEGQKTIDIFRGFATAGRSLKLSQAQMSSAFIAIQQMMTKGKVQSQEMVLQLGGALPGALSRAAEAMGVTKARFSEMMERGQIQAEEFLPQFAQYLENLYGPGVKNAIGSLQAKMIVLENQTVTTMDEIGKSTSGVYLSWMQIKLKVLNLIKYALNIYNKYKGIIDTVAVAIATMVALMGTYYVVMKAGAAITAVMNGVQAIYRAYTLASAVATGGFQAAWIALNTAFAISPIGFIITLVAGLVAGLIYAYNTSDKFRAALDGLGETAKSVFSAIWDYLKLIMAPLTFVVRFISADGNWKERGKAALDGLISDNVSMLNNLDDAISGKAYRRGRDASKQKSEDKNALNTVGGDNEIAGAPTTPTSGGGASESVSSGRSVRNVSVRIDKQIFDLKVYTATAKESMTDVKRMVQDALNRAVMDFEGAL
ncbi:MAG: tape measure protein [Bacteroidetes bacterium]|nr:tape measure protein [Bacteroidota bacterium]